MSVCTQFFTETGHQRVYEKRFEQYEQEYCNDDVPEFTGEIEVSQSENNEAEKVDWRQPEKVVVEEGNEKKMMQVMSMVDISKLGAKNMPKVHEYSVISGEMKDFLQCEGLKLTMIIRKIGCLKVDDC